MSNSRTGQFSLRLPAEVCKELNLLSFAIERVLTRRPGIAHELYRMVRPLLSRISTTCPERELSSAAFQDLLRMAERAQNATDGKAGQLQVNSSRPCPA